MSGMSCSTTTIEQPSSSRRRSDERAERLGLALGDARRRLVEQQDRGLWATTAARSTTRREPVESSPTKLSRNRPSSNSSMSSCDPQRDGVLAVDVGGHAEHRR